MRAFTLPAGAGLFALLAVLASAGIALMLAVSAPAMGAAVAVLLLGAAWLSRNRQPRRLLIAALFFLAPMDISKAVMPPLGEYFSPGLYLSPAHLTGLVLLVLVVGQRLLWERRLPRLDRLDALVLLFVGIMFWRAFTSAQGLLAVATAVAYSLGVVAYYATAYGLRDKSDVRLALAAAAAVLLLESMHVALQMSTGQLFPLPGAKNMFPAVVLTLDGMGGAMRPIGFQSHPNALAYFMVIMFPPALALLLLGRRRLGNRVFTVCAAVLLTSLIMLLVALSRGGWIAGALSILFIVVALGRAHVLSGRQLAAFALASGFAVVIALVSFPQIITRVTGSDSRSTESRVLLTDQAITMIRANPWAGVGYGNYNRSSFQYIGPRFATISEDYQKQLRTLVVHNHYLLLAAELGLPAMFLFMLLLWKFVRLAWPLRRFNDPVMMTLAVGIAGSLAGQALYLSSDNYYADTRLFLMWLSIGLLRATVRLGTEQPVGRGVAA